MLFYYRASTSRVTSILYQASASNTINKSETTKADEIERTPIVATGCVAIVGIATATHLRGNRSTERKHDESRLNQAARSYC